MSLYVHIKDKRYRGSNGYDHTVIGDVTFRAPDRQFTCIAGPSGCGKTTILNIIAGLEPCPQATIQFNDESIDKTNVAYVFQEPRLMPWLSVLDNITLVTDNTPQRREQAMTILRTIGLDDVSHEFPNRLSGGMQRRVALARAFITQPQMMLMDEPFVSLDPKLAQNIRKNLLDIWNKTPSNIVFITHDLNEALFLADRILFIGQKPAKILLDYSVTLPRPRKNIPYAEIEALKDTLLSQHPHLFKPIRRHVEP
ncbi:MAG: ABC transporter ATP-binding protein [Alphaproteobacteria bacterium GM202ARS2]|nr:ABC transporter ATP-binding protein [Alphaproteobacteria bacterium GM202ARS2]